MVPRLVPEISSLDAFCDGGAAAAAAAGGAGIWDSRSLIRNINVQIVQKQSPCFFSGILNFYFLVSLP